MGEKILRMGVGLFVGVWVARYLGPEQFGLLSYAQSFVFLFTAISTLGLDGIIVRELVQDEAKRDKLLGAAFGLKLIGAILIFPILAIAIQMTNNDQYTNTLVFIIASATIFQSFNVIDFYYQSKVLSKYAALANSISFGFSSLIKILLLINHAPLIAFAVVIVVDAFLLAIGLIYYYRKTSQLTLLDWTFDWVMAKSLLKDSWPLTISAIVVTIYMKIDIIMLKNLVDEFDVGIYAASSRISELWYFIPVLMTTSLFPAILNARKKSSLIYNNRVKNLYKILVWMAVLFSVMIGFIGEHLILFLFGAEYARSASVLMIQIWNSVFIAFLMVSNKWLLAENKTKFIFMRGACGAVLNVGLNYIFIPKYGVHAAAYTSLVTLIFTSLFIDVFTTSTRQHLHLKLSVLLPRLCDAK